MLILPPKVQDAPTRQVGSAALHGSPPLARADQSSAQWPSSTRPILRESRFTETPGHRRRALTKVPRSLLQRPRRWRHPVLTAALHPAAIRATAELPRTGPRGRTERARTARRPRSGGHRARICHAGRHASALRGCRAQVADIELRRDGSGREGVAAVQVAGRWTFRPLRPCRTGREGSRGPVPRRGLADSARRSRLWRKRRATGSVVGSRMNCEHDRADRRYAIALAASTVHVDSRNASCGLRQGKEGGEG